MFETIISAHAASTPDAPAFVLPSGTFSYRQFDNTITLMAQALGPWSLPAGSLVVVADQRPFFHWCTLFALDRLGFTTVSADSAGHAARLPGVKGIITDDATRTLGIAKAIVTDKSWLSTALSASAMPTTSHRNKADDAARIILSSGTTGLPKASLFTRALVDRRVANRAKLRAHPHTRFSTAMGLNTAGGYMTPMGIWQSGGVVAYGGERGLAEALETMALNSILLSPMQLQSLLGQLSPAFMPSSELVVTVGGGPVPPHIATQAGQRLSPTVLSLYGSTEGGYIGIGNAVTSKAPTQVRLTSYPWTKVEFVGDDHKPVQDGAVGRLRLRGDEMVGSYFSAQNGQADSYADGWFYPGDLGFRNARDQFTLVARTDDVINLGGVKLSVEQLEHQLSGIGGVLDVGVVANQAAESNFLTAALVLAEGSDLKTVSQIAKQRVNVLSQVLQVTSLPRNDMGKLMRAQLAEAVRAYKPPAG